MNVYKNNISADTTGNYKPRSIFIAMVGPNRVSTLWALNSMYLQIPTYCGWRVRMFEDKDLAVAINEAKEAFKVDEEQPEWLLIWPAETFYEWNTVIRLLELNCVQEVILGNGRAYHRSYFNTPPSPPRIPIAPLDLTDELTSTTPPELPEVPITDERVNPERSVIVCVPTIGTASLTWATSLIAMDGPMGLNTYLHVVKGYEVGEARCKLVDAVLKMKAPPKFFFFLGDDNIPMPNGIQRLFYVLEKCNLRAVSGLYKRKAHPPEYVAWINQSCIVEHKGFELGDIVEVDGCGLDFCLMYTEDLAKMANPRFKTVHDENRIMTEDVWFWRKYWDTFKKRPFVDTSCLVGHYEWRGNKIW